MARTALTATVAPGPFPTAGTAVTMNVGDASNNNFFAFAGNELVVVKNAHASAAKTVTLTSVVDDQGRTGDITDSLVAGEVRVYGPFTDKTGWKQNGNQFWMSPESTDIKIAVIKLPQVY